MCQAVLETVEGPQKSVRGACLLSQCCWDSEWGRPAFMTHGKGYAGLELSSLKDISSQELRRIKEILLTTADPRGIISKV